MSSFFPGWAAATPLSEGLKAGATYGATINYQQSAAVEQVQVKAVQGKTLTTQALQQLQSKYQALAKEAFEGLNGAYQMTLTGKPEKQGQELVLPLQGKLKAPSYSLGFQMRMTPSEEGYYRFDMSPMLSLMWGGSGQPPLAQIRQETHDHLIDIMTSANAPFGFEQKPTQTMNDGLRPLNLGMAEAEGDLHASTILNWASNGKYQTQIVAKPGQQLKVLGITAQVLNATLSSAGQPLRDKMGNNWPGKISTSTLLRFQMPYPNQDQVDVQMTVLVKTATQQDWSIKP